jgi:hypothetical protein
MGWHFANQLLLNQELYPHDLHRLANDLVLKKALKLAQLNLQVKFLMLCGGLGVEI